LLAVAARRILLVAAVVLLLGACTKSPYDDELGNWRVMCSGVIGPPAPTVDEEFAHQQTPNTKALFDEYLLSVPAERFPSPVRGDLTALRQADLDYRSGKLTGDQAKAAGAAGTRALTNQHEEGACAYFTRQHS
jgi:hypothetical protein